MDANSYLSSRLFNARVYYRWQLYIQVVSYITVSYLPITLTARFLRGENYSLKKNSRLEFSTSDLLTPRQCCKHAILRLTKSSGVAPRWSTFLCMAN